MERHTSRESCPNYTAAKNGNCPRGSLNWSSLVICACAMNTAAVDFPDNFQFGQDNENDWQERERERYRLRIGLARNRSR